MKKSDFRLIQKIVKIFLHNHPFTYRLVKLILKIDAILLIKERNK